MPGDTPLDRLVSELETLSAEVSGALDVHEAAAKACKVRKETLEGVVAHLRSWVTIFDDSVVPYVAGVTQWAGDRAGEGWMFGDAISTWSDRATGLTTENSNHSLPALRHAAERAAKDIAEEVEAYGRLASVIGEVKVWFDGLAAGSMAHIANMAVIRSSRDVVTARELAAETQSWLAERVTEAWGVRRPLVEFDTARARPVVLPSSFPRPDRDLARAAVAVSQRVAAALPVATRLVESEVFEQ